MYKKIILSDLYILGRFFGVDSLGSFDCTTPCQGKRWYYLITWNFRDTLISRFCKHFVFWVASISRFWERHDLFTWQGYVTRPWLNKRIKKSYISNNQAAWIGFKNDSIRSTFKSSQWIPLFTCFRTWKLFVTHSVGITIHSFLIIYSMFHLIFASCYFRDTFFGSLWIRDFS